MKKVPLWSFVSSAAAGDVVEFGDGNYTAACSSNNSMLSVYAGITLRAQHPGQVVLDAQGGAPPRARPSAPAQPPQAAAAQYELID